MIQYLKDRWCYSIYDIRGVRTQRVYNSKSYQILVMESRLIQCPFSQNPIINAPMRMMDLDDLFTFRYLNKQDRSNVSNFKVKVRLRFVQVVKATGCDGFGKLLLLLIGLLIIFNKWQYPWKNTTIIYNEKTIIRILNTHS